MFLDTDESTCPSSSSSWSLSAWEWLPCHELMVHLLQPFGISTSSCCSYPLPFSYTHHVFYFLSLPMIGKVVCRRSVRRNRLGYFLYTTHAQPPRSQYCLHHVQRDLRNTFWDIYFCISQISWCISLFYLGNEAYFHCFMKDGKSWWVFISFYIQHGKTAMLCTSPSHYGWEDKIFAKSKKNWEAVI